MPDALTEHAIAQYIAEQTDELIALVNFCQPSDRVQFLVYLLGMVRSEARQIYEDAPEPGTRLVYSKTATPTGGLT